jgi:hypothetical protein
MRPEALTELIDLYEDLGGEQLPADEAIRSYGLLVDFFECNPNKLSLEKFIEKRMGNELKSTSFGSLPQAIGWIYFSSQNLQLFLSYFDGVKRNQDKDTKPEISELLYKSYGFLYFLINYNQYFEEILNERNFNDIEDEEYAELLKFYYINWKQLDWKISCFRDACHMIQHFNVANKLSDNINAYTSQILALLSQLPEKLKQDIGYYLKTRQVVKHFANHLESEQYKDVLLILWDYICHQEEVDKKLVELFYKIISSVEIYTENTTGDITFESDVNKALYINQQNFLLCLNQNKALVVEKIQQVIDKIKNPSKQLIIEDDGKKNEIFIFYKENFLVPFSTVERFLIVKGILAGAICKGYAEKHYKFKKLYNVLFSVLYNKFENVPNEGKQEKSVSAQSDILSVEKEDAKELLFSLLKCVREDDDVLEGLFVELCYSLKKCTLSEGAYSLKYLSFISLINNTHNTADFKKILKTKKTEILDIFDAILLEYKVLSEILDSGIIYNLLNKLIDGIFDDVKLVIIENKKEEIAQYALCNLKSEKNFFVNLEASTTLPNAEIKASVSPNLCIEVIDKNKVEEVSSHKRN